MRIIKSFALYENVQQAKSILSKLGIPETDKTYKEIRELLKHHVGYVGWFTKMHFEEGLTFNDLKEIYENFIVGMPEVISALPKPLISYDNIEKLYDDLFVTKNNIILKRIVNEFPATQKEFINIDSKIERDKLSQLYKREDKENFLKKVSRYKTKKDLYEAIDLFLSGKGSKGYENVLRDINKTEAKIIYNSSSDDLIVCRVTYPQLKKLASHTSWCILDSGTYESYADGIDLQYIAFLTDKTGNNSLIGITYGFQFRTAHLVDDEYISEGKLSKLLSERGFELSSLARSKEDVLTSPESKNAKVKALLSKGFKKADILKYKKSFYKEDLKSFTKEEIEQYKLNDNLILTQNDVDRTELTYDFLKQNKDRFDSNVELELNHLMEIYPSPGQLDILMDYSFWDEEVKTFYKFLQDNRNKILTKYKEGRYPDCIDTFDLYVYTLKYCGVSSFSYDFSDIKVPKLMYHEGDLKTLVDFFKANGFDYTKKEIYKLVCKFDFGSRKNIGQWISMVKEEPLLKDCLYDIVMYIVSGDKPKTLTKDELYESGYSYYYRPSELYPYLSKLTKLFPEVKEKLTTEVEYSNTIKTMHKILPSTQYQNYGLGRREVTEYQKKMGRDNPAITPRQLYDDFYDKIKDRELRTNGHGSDILPTLYMIFALVKLNKYTELGKLKLSWNTEFVGKLIRLALGTYKYNGKSYLYDNYHLTEKQREKFFEWLNANALDKIKGVISNYDYAPGEMELRQHECFSLVYYLYDWGFNNYMKMVEKFKSRFKEKWTRKQTSNKDNTGIVDYGMVRPEKTRLDFFKHIIEYYRTTEDNAGYKEFIDKIMNAGWNWTKMELEQLKDRFANDYIPREISTYFRTKYMNNRGEVIVP